VTGRGLAWRDLHRSRPTQVCKGSARIRDTALPVPCRIGNLGRNRPAHRYTLLSAYSSVQSIHLFVCCVGMYTRLFQSDCFPGHPYEEKQDESNHCYTLLISSFTTSLLPFLALAVKEGGEWIRKELIDSLRWLRTQLSDIPSRIIERIRIQITRLWILGLLVSISTLTVSQLHLNIASFSH